MQTRFILITLSDLLVVAVFVGPAATARQFTERIAPMLALAVAVAVLAGIVGLYLSYYAGTAGGAGDRRRLPALPAGRSAQLTPGRRKANAGGGYDRLMPTAVDTTWAEHALTRLGEAGYRRGGARTAVVEALARHDCAVSALALEEELRRRKVHVGRASIYRALDVLEELGLVQRFEVERGIASYERVNLNGHHHHHAICRSCGRMEPFEDRSLERAIEQVSDLVPFEIAEHDVVLRGLCERCAN